MKSNMKIALQRAQKGIVPKPPKYSTGGRNLPKAQVQNPQLRERSWLGRLGTKIGNIFRPDHRDRNPYVTRVDPTTRKNLPTYFLNDDWGNTAVTEQTGSIIAPDGDVQVQTQTQPIPNPSAQELQNMQEQTKIWPEDRIMQKEGGDVGSSNYMKALKQARKGGSTRYKI